MRTYRNHLWSAPITNGRALLLLLLGLAGGGRVGGADAPEAAALRALPLGQAPQDQRLGPLKDLDGYFPFTPAATPAAWAVRAERVRRDLAVALGLWPMPDKTPLNPVVHGRVEREDYTIERVYFESVPGFFVTGSLYRPRGKAGKLPGVLCPHGHWSNGRFLDTPPAEVNKAIQRGEERFTEGGRSVLQARCVQLARMGCVVFHYDMIGYADSLQIPQSLAHGFAKQRPEMNTPVNWGLFSPQAEARLQSVMGLQTWNSIRALDFLMSLPDVDPARVAVTGASGGGTQTFILGALDSRPAVAFPAVMVGTAMQGGCSCENACLLRVDTANVEIAALFAPKPLGLTAANDWTKEMPTKGFPELQQHFAMLGAPANVALTPLLQFGHNYNYVSRAAMYTWLNRHLQLGVPEPVVEPDYHYATRAELSVWDAEHPRPEGGPEFERKLLRWMTARDEGLLAQAQGSPETFRQVYGGAFEVILGGTLARSGPVAFALARQAGRGDYQEKLGLLRHPARGAELPLILLEPKASRRQTVIWVDGQGKSGLFGASGSTTPIPAVRELLRQGLTVIGVDLLFQGEFLTNGQAVTRARVVNNPRELAAYTFGYNYTLFAQRVQDLLSVIRFSRDSIGGSEGLHLAGVNGAGPWVAAARAQAGTAVAATAIDTGGFRFANITDYQDINFLPGAVKYGDLPGLLALGGPGPLWLAGEGNGVPALVQKMLAASAEKRVTLSQAEGAAGTEAAARWLAAQAEAMPRR